MHVTPTSVFSDFSFPLDMEDAVSETISLIPLTSNYILIHTTFLNVSHLNYTECVLDVVYETVCALKRKYRVIFNGTI